MKFLELQNIVKSYTIGDETFVALNNVDFAVEKNEFVAIMGPSGSGKSTMLHILGCLDMPDSGKYILDGHDITELSDNELSKIRNRNIGFVFQSFNLLPRFSVYENVVLPFMYSDIPKGEWQKRAIDALEKVGLTDKMENKPNQLSGGQRQRVAIARSLVMNPKIILADEPTGNLDTKTGDQIMNIFSDIHKQGATIILITHEPDIAQKAGRVVHIKDGEILSS